jgi:beta-xylosidase
LAHTNQTNQTGDFALLVDPRDGTSAYVAYDAWNNGHRVRVEKLNDDWTASLPGAAHTTGDISEPDVEAPIFFERNGWFYLIYTLDPPLRIQKFSLCPHS